MCSNGSWGEGCNRHCGRCKGSQLCDKRTGECPGACEPGYQNTSLCDTREMLYLNTQIHVYCNKKHRILGTKTERIRNRYFAKVDMCLQLLSIWSL